MVTIDRERLISEKQNNKASPTGARLPKEAMLLYAHLLLHAEVKWYLRGKILTRLLILRKEIKLVFLAAQLFKISRTLIRRWMSSLVFIPGKCFFALNKLNIALQGQRVYSTR